MCILEEQISVVCNVSFGQQILHEVAYKLHILLAATLHLSLGVELGTGALSLVDNREEINSSISLHW